MIGETCGTAPILCAHLLRRVDEELIDLLRSLAPGEWDIRMSFLGQAPKVS